MISTAKTNRFIKKEKRKAKRKKVVFYFFILIIIGGLVYLFAFSPIFKIKSIDISGNRNIPSEEIISNLQNRNIFLTTKSSIKNQLIKKFPEILDLKLSKNLFKRELHIEIIEREAIGILCAEDKCFYFDKDGIVFGSTSANSEGTTIIVKDYSDRNYNLGDKVFDKNLIDNILSIKNELASKLDLGVSSFDIDTYPIEELRVVTNESWYILFNLKNNIKSQLSALEVALNEKIQNRSALQYIDLRIENRIYYK